MDSKQFDKNKEKSIKAKCSMGIIFELMNEINFIKNKYKDFINEMKNIYQK